MPNGGPTASTRITARSLCFFMYSLAIIVSVADLFVPSSSLAAFERDWTVGLALALGGLSLFGLVACMAHRWRLEWTPATIVALLLFQRTIPVWASLDTSPGSLAAAAGMTLGSLCVGRRALDLWIFHVKTKASAERFSDVRR